MSIGEFRFLDPYLLEFPVRKYWFYWGGYAPEKLVNNACGKDPDFSNSENKSENNNVKAFKYSEFQNTFEHGVEDSRLG